jgi:hypothetical protein
MLDVDNMEQWSNNSIKGILPLGPVGPVGPDGPMYQDNGQQIASVAAKNA